MPTLQEEAQTFVAPEVFNGDSVLFYMDGDKALHPYVGFIVKADGRIVDVITFDWRGMQFRQEVRHVDDPMIKLNPEIKKNGGWAFNRRQSDAGNVHLILKAFEDRFDTSLADVKWQVQQIADQLDIKFSPRKAPASDVPVVSQAPPESPADVGLRPVQFSPSPTTLIEGGVAKNIVTPDQLIAFLGEKASRIGPICEKLNASDDQVMGIIRSDPRFTYTEPGWIRYVGNKAE